MLKLYKNKDSSFTQRIERTLQDMVLAHKVVDGSDPEVLPKNVQPAELPVLSDTHQVWKKQENIEAYLDELNREVTLSRSLQSDACHIDPDNPDQCL